MNSQLFLRGWSLCMVILQAAFMQVHAQATNKISLVTVDSGWAANSVNAVVFRKNSLVSDRQWQYIAYYNADKYVVLGKRKLGTVHWQLQKTVFKGNTNDAHNMISIMVDGDGYLHMAWDHHNNKLNYARSVKPGSLQMSDRQSMTGELEGKVTYPEFYHMPSGDLVFFYRDGGSGNGNLVINYYRTKNKEWKQLHQNLVDGEGKRNAYWQACTDDKGSIHISWVWRESTDVASNHDMCYARSDDGGVTWVKSTGEAYTLPINAANAEYACKISQSSELINQTSMYADEKGNPWIASYWRSNNDSIPQYQVVYKRNGKWNSKNLGFRKTPFSLSGVGTKSIPISRPQIISAAKGSVQQVIVVLRDRERDNRVSVASTNDISSDQWKLTDLAAEDLGSWEPSYDTELWKRKKILHIFIQKVEQVDAEGRSKLPPQMVKVLEWKPGF